MDHWKSLSTDKMRVLRTTVWSASGSRNGTAARFGYSTSKLNAQIADSAEQGLLAEVAHQASSGGQCAKTVQLNAGQANLIGVRVLAIQETLWVCGLAP